MSDLTLGQDDMEEEGGEVPVGAHLMQADLARRVGVSIRTLERWRVAGRGPAWLDLHGRVRYARADVLAWEAARRRPAGDRP